jgi:UDP-N-acetylmuramoyl-tripeptide--D-alanyl-D-alanine ligase
MDPRSIQFVARVCQGELYPAASGSVVSRVCTDSRRVQAGDLFVALVGDRFDGHAFCGEALARGAAAFLVARGRDLRLPDAAVAVRVDDTRRALAALAGAYRDQFQIRPVVVVGSNGKTTVKELAASVLRQRLPTLWSEASFNNDLGVPLTLLRLEKYHGAAVLEAGTNHPGELAPLLRLIRPHYGILTGIGREHLEFFGDLDGVAREEGSVAESLPPDGRLWVHGDAPCLDAVQRRARLPLVRVGWGADNAWRLVSARVEPDGTRFALEAPDPAYAGEYRVALLGRHQALNAAFAVALGAEFGLGRDAIARGLATCAPAPRRLQLSEAGGVRWLDDCYNANADSTEAALRTLSELAGADRRVAVLGDMAELGAQTEAAHREVGGLAGRLGVERLFAVGAQAAVTAAAARAAGVRDAREFDAIDSCAHALRAALQPGDTDVPPARRGLRRLLLRCDAGFGHRPDGK